jgi:hypothetical protein
MRSLLNKLPDFSELLHSKILLYVLVFVSIVNIFTYVSTNNQTYAGFMILIGFLASFFSKNMIVIMFTAIAITNLIRFGMETSVQMREGFDMAGLDELTKHLTEKADDTAPTIGSTSNDEDSNEAEKQMTATIDAKLEELIRTIDSNGMIDKLDKSSDAKQLKDARDKLELALKHIDQITNEQQRDKVKSLLAVQLKMVEYLAGISPLVGEFKLALSSIKK